MYKYIFTTLALIFYCTCIFASEPKNNSQKQNNKPPAKVPATPDFQTQMKDFENQQRMLNMKMYQLRIKLISEDSDLLLMHNQIMKLHKKLAIELNNNDEMKDLRNQSNELNKKIMQLMQPEDKNKSNTETDTKKADTEKKKLDKPQEKNNE